MKNANPNAVLSKNNCNKILKNRKSPSFLLHKLDLDMTYSFANKDDKIANRPKYGIGLSSFAYINIQAKARFR